MKAFSILTFKLFKVNSFPEMMGKNENFHLAKETLQTLLSIKPVSREEAQMIKWHNEAHKLLKKISE